MLPPNDSVTIAATFVLGTGRWINMNRDKRNPEIHNSASPTHAHA